jgi:hypothetical protein
VDCIAGFGLKVRMQHPSLALSCVPSVLTPVGYCKGCGDSLSTEMHLSNGPCDQLYSNSSARLDLPPSSSLPSESQIPLLCVPAYSSARKGLCAGCGDSLSTPMNIDNGPCI